MKPWVLLSFLALAAGAPAAERGFYVGGGWSSVDASYARSDRVIYPAATAGVPEGFFDPVDLDPLGSQARHVFAGYRALDWLALEADFGKFSGNSRYTRITCFAMHPCPTREAGEADVSAFSALGIYPRGSIDLFVRAGVARWRAELSTYDSDGTRFATSRDSGTEITYGGGAQAHLGRIVTRLELQRVKLGDDAATLLTLGVACTF